jgi:general secretion pathway protein G
MYSHYKKRGFTLIELLIVVAIIGILAAIAVPNFLSAQVRAKVSKVQAEFVTLSNALAAYQIDHNRLPPMTDRNKTYLHYRVSNFLTTPISYINSAPIDPFQVDEDPFGMITDPSLFPRYRYHDVKQLVNTNDVVDIPATQADIDVFGDWRFISLGPDRKYQGYTRYNPSNGILSRGDVYRAQKGIDNNLTADNRIGSGTFR